MKLLALAISSLAIFQPCPPLTLEIANFPSLEEVTPIDKTQSIRSETIRDPKLETAILQTYSEYKEYAIKNGDYIRYYYNKVDLNGDNKPDVIVHLVSSYFCGTGGCTTLIFQNLGQEYRLVSTIYVNHPPIIVANEKTFDWHNLIILASGNSRDSASGYYLLQFNGKTYPHDPKDGTELPLGKTITGEKLMVDIESNPGIVIRP